MTLSIDALRVWREIYEYGYSLREHDEDADLPAQFLDDDESWSAERLESALGELRSTSTLKEDGSVLGPSGGGAAQGSDGTLVDVVVHVYSRDIADKQQIQRLVRSLVDSVVASLTKQ